MDQRIRPNTCVLRPGGYTPPPLPEPDELCTADELALYVTHYIKFDAGTWGNDPTMALPLSDAGIGRLVTLAFYASMAPEEGKYCRFKIISRQSVGHPYEVTRFDPIRLHSVETLRRLVPTCTDPEYALLVVERDGGLWCDGIVSVSALGADTVPGRPEILSQWPAGSFLRIEVKAPGHLVAGGMVIAYELRMGNVRQLSMCWPIQAVQEFGRQLGSRLQEDLVKECGEDAKQMFGGTGTSFPIHAVLGRMLRVATEQRRGGTFVILPQDSCDAENYCLSVNFALSEEILVSLS